MRKFALLLTIGLFLSAATANASDGDKGANTTGKVTHSTSTHKSATVAKRGCSPGTAAKCPKGACAKKGCAAGTANSNSKSSTKTAAARTTAAAKS
jgi:hypothetical protein